MTNFIVFSKNSPISGIIAQFQNLTMMMSNGSPFTDITQ